VAENRHTQQPAFYGRESELHELRTSFENAVVQATQKAKATRVGKTVAEVEAWLVKKGFGRVESKVAVELAQAWAADEPL
jgi:hypothetical protein